MQRQVKTVALGALVFCVATSGEALQAAAPATAPEDIGKKEEQFYEGTWRGKLGSPPAEHRAEFLHEVYELDHAKTPGEQAAHAKAALALRPKDPDNLALEFRMVSSLTNDMNPATGRGSMDEILDALRHIVETYDYKSYYRAHPVGSSDMPDRLVLQSTIWLASFENDKEKAKKYAALALEQMDWSFKKRTADWLNAPKPETQPNPFFDEPGRATGRLEAWEKDRAAADAGKAVGPYDEVMAQAAVRTYLGAYAAKPAESEGILRQLAEKYPKSPLSRAAEAELVARAAAATRAATRAATKPATRPSVVVDPGLP